MLFSYEGFRGKREEVEEKKREPRDFWRRCVLGEHAYPSRTRGLSLGRPMVLYWRRYGRVGGCQIKKEKRFALQATGVQEI